VSPDVRGGGEGGVAAAGALALPLGAPAGLAESVGDLPAAVVRLVRGEAYLFDAVGSPVARPPVDIRCRLRFFHRTDLCVDQINAVLRGGWHAECGGGWAR
jgi:hypothetical protein